MKIANPRILISKPNHAPILNYSDEELIALGEKMVKDYNAGRGPQVGDFTFVYNNILNLKSDYITCQTCRDARFKQLENGIQMVKDQIEKDKIEREKIIAEQEKIITEQEKEKLIKDTINNVPVKKPRGRPFQKKNNEENK